MKRLIRKINSVTRLKRRILADWVPVDTNSPDLVQIITDAMAAQTQIQVEYEGSGWRLILPYGWNTSKDGNVLLMCYKDTGEVRSYRLDRILQVLVDNSVQQMEQQNDVTDTGLEIRDYNATPGDFEVPLLPNIDEVLKESENEPGRELPYDQGLDYLTDENMEHSYEEDVNNEKVDNDMENNEQHENTIERNVKDDNKNQNFEDFKEEKEIEELEKQHKKEDKNEK